MLSAQRHAVITARLAQHGFVQTAALSAELGVDSSTIRRDFVSLEAAGQLKRTHGGAAAATDASGAAAGSDVPYSQKRAERVTAKQAIGAAAAARIADHATVLLDSGSTTYEVAAALPGHSDLTVVTNDLHIAHLLADAGSVRLVVTGGELLASVYTLVGDPWLDIIAAMHVDWAILGADAIDVRAGITNTNTAEPRLKQTMARIADRVMVVADSSKFGQRALVPVLGLDQVDLFVTDAKVPADYGAALGDRLEVAPVDGS